MTLAYAFLQAPLRRLIRDESGATAVEYAALAALIAAATYPMVSVAGSNVDHPFEEVNLALSVNVEEQPVIPSFNTTMN